MSIIFIYLLLTALCVLSSVSTAADILVKHTSGYSCSLTFLNKTMPCSLGKNGVTNDKHEGDGKTPTGRFPLRRIFYRSDKIIEPFLPLSHPEFITVNATETNFVTPFTESHEDLWLSSSNVYDLLAVIGYNDAPVVPNLGSAIFFHVTETYGSTAGTH